MTRVIIDTEPFLDIREAKDGEDGFHVSAAAWRWLKDSEATAERARRAVVEEVVVNNPSHPDVPALREYLKETG